MTTRDLTTGPLAKAFLIEALGFSASDPGTDAIAIVVSEEEAKLQAEPGDTLSNRMKRDKRHRSTADRGRLRNAVIRELFSQRRLPDDDQIRLGLGGCRPADLRQERRALVVLGPPAAGKSGLAVRLADAVGGMIVDSDYVKRKLPEYWTHGASAVHRESSKMVDGDGEEFMDCLFDRVTDCGANMVYPRVGRDQREVEALIARLRARGYAVGLAAVRLPPREAAKRALLRFMRDIRRGRYVPLSYVYEDVGERPWSVYNNLRVQGGCDGYEAYSTDVQEGQPPIWIEDRSTCNHLEPAGRT